MLVMTGSDDQLVLGKWPDGFAAELNKTMAFVKGLTRSSHSGSKGEGSLWEGDHVATKHRLHLSQRTDRNLLISLYGPGAYDASQYVEAGSMSPILPLDPADNLTSDGQNGVSIFKPVDNLGSSVAPVLQYEPAKGSDNLAGDDTDLDRRLRELRGPGRKGEFIILFLILIV